MYQNRREANEQRGFETDYFAAEHRRDQRRRERAALARQPHYILVDGQRVGPFPTLRAARNHAYNVLGIGVYQQRFERVED